MLEVLESGMLVQGERTELLESEFARLAGTKHAVATSSGTAGLYLALLAHGIGPGDEVITTAFTFVATVNAVLQAGAMPAFVDIERDTFNIDASLIERAITPRTKAILPVHLYGQPCQLDDIYAIADQHHLAVVEDCAQAVGASFQSRSVGSLGTGVFSLYATKNVMAGEGGIVTTNDGHVAAQLKLLRNHGMRRRYDYEGLGFNLRLSDLHAAIGLAQLRRLSEFTTRRRANAAYLSRQLTSVEVPRVAAQREHVWHQYTIRVGGKRNRDQAAALLNRKGIGTGIFYPTPLHRLRHVRQVVGDCCLPVTDGAAAEVLSLPVHPGLERADLDQIVDAVNSL